MNYFVITETTEPHWLSFRHENSDTGYAKWDGCCDIPNPFDPGGESMHICNLPSFIAQLEELQSLARAHFGQDWPDILAPEV